LVKNRHLNLPHPYLMPSLGWYGWNFAESFGIRNLQSLGYRTALFVWSCI